MEDKHHPDSPWHEDNLPGPAMVGAVVIGFVVVLAAAVYGLFRLVVWITS